MRKVLYILHFPVFGGPHNQALRLHQSLARRSWQTVVLLPNEQGNALTRLRSAGIEVMQMPLHRLRATADPRVQLPFLLSAATEIAAMRRIIRANHIDLVLVAGLANPHGAIAARLEGVPVVWQLLDSRVPRALRWMLMPLVRVLADCVMSTGTEIARRHPGAIGLGTRLVCYVPPVDAAVFHPDPARKMQARDSLGLGDSDVVIGNVGNINRQKGHRTFIRAAALLRRSYPNARFVILGATPANHAAYASQLWHLAETLGLRMERDLIVRDPGPEVAQFASAFDLFWLTSEASSEGIPTVVVEAMALGIPVIAVDVGAVREVIENGVTGYVTAESTPEAIVAATKDLLGDPSHLDRIGKLARGRAVRTFSAEVCADTHISAFETAIAHHQLRNIPSLLQARVRSPQAQSALDLIVCPACRSSLDRSSNEHRCTRCARVYPVDDGIPILLAQLHDSDHDELDHGRQACQKGQQAAYFDRDEAAEFEISRPHDAPGLYRWLLTDKFRRSLTGIESCIPGAVVLSVCGGSGMDAEFLARAGARVVITSDISIGASRRARERAQRYGLPIVPVVADVEHLPFRDHSIDVVYVHDGLHHLVKPTAGLHEMARVALHAISVTEPARAAVTGLAVRVGLALEREEAGNRVARVSCDELSGALQRQGFHVVQAERYAMYYRHYPGRISRALSSPAVLPFVAGAIRLANHLMGGAGNKLTVQAVRP